MKPSMIVLEGLNGAGKTTTAKELAAVMAQYGHKTVVLRDPGSTAIGESIRHMVKSPSVPMSPLVQMMLYTAARVALAEEVQSRVRDGWWVVMDRWWPSTYAYQGAYGVSKQLILDLNNRVMPDEAQTTRYLTFWLDLPIDECLRRSGAGKGQGMEDGGDRFEREGAKLMKVLRDGYEELVRREMITRVDMLKFPSAAEAARYLWFQYIGPVVDPPKGD